MKPSSAAQSCTLGPFNDKALDAIHLVNESTLHVLQFPWGNKGVIVPTECMVCGWACRDKMSIQFRRAIIPLPVSH